MLTKHQSLINTWFSDFLTKNKQYSSNIVFYKKYLFA